MSLRNLHAFSSLAPPAGEVNREANNFDFIRFVAASLVLYSHCFALTGLGGHEPLVRLTQGKYALGGLAVRVFFVISGFLVMQSWLRRPRWLSFAGARVLRILPGLAVALAYCVVVGSVVTTLSAIEYWKHPETLAFYWHNLRMRTEFFLPGVFERNVFPRGVNGSIWSLHFEYRAYLVVLVLGVVGAFRRRWLGSLAWLVAAMLIFVWPRVWGIQVRGDWPVINLYLCFVGGALIALHPKLLRATGPVSLIAFGVLVFSVGSLTGEFAMDVFLVCGTLWLAYVRLPYVAHFGRFGDFSYGVFIYAFPTQQIIAWWTGMREPYLMLATAFPATLALAALSWHLVEKPCLDLKRLLRGSRRTVPAIGAV